MLYNEKGMDNCTTNLSYTDFWSIHTAPVTPAFDCLSSLTLLSVSLFFLLSLFSYTLIFFLGSNCRTLEICWYTCRSKQTNVITSRTISKWEQKQHHNVQWRLNTFSLVGCKQEKLREASGEHRFSWANIQQPASGETDSKHRLLYCSLNSTFGVFVPVVGIFLFGSTLSILNMMFLRCALASFVPSIHSQNSPMPSHHICSTLPAVPLVHKEWIQQSVRAVPSSLVRSVSLHQNDSAHWAVNVDG